jgi:hypothetical protein
MGFSPTTLSFNSEIGFGSQASGGRGGSVYVVTNLNDSGSGSFRDAVSQSNRVFSKTTRVHFSMLILSKIVVFAVGGVINISSRIVVSNHITIAGQTAPGQGITVYGNGISYSNANNTITRYIRYRMGKSGAYFVTISTR